MKVKAFYLLILLSLICLLAVMGCSIDNSLYNARKNFISARNRPLNPNGKPTQTAIDEYTKTIKKCGYILTDRKNSKEADDALFLLASALFYKGNSQFQAKDQFDSLIRNFPQSPFVPEAVMYIAQIYRQINKPADAEVLLEEYVRNPENAKWHPMALLLLADFSIQDKDFEKAEYWLQRILTNYPNTLQYKEANFLLGKNFFARNDYTNSLNQFRKVAGERGISPEVKLDSRYYVALNLLLLNENKKSLDSVNKLLKKETRPDKISQVKLLKARILLDMQKDEEAKELFLAIIKAYPKTPVSADAYYWLAENDYYLKHDAVSAAENYNKAKNESASSTYVNDATQKFNALTQISQSAKIGITNDGQAFVDAKLTAAENFYRVLNKPDSAFVIFKEITDAPALMQPHIDSLSVEDNYIKARMDSLVVKEDTTGVKVIIPPDSSLTTTIDSTKQVSDTLRVETAKDSLSLIEKIPPVVNETLSAPSDTLSMSNKIPVNKPDSLLALPDKIKPAPTGSTNVRNISPTPDSLEVKLPKTIERTDSPAVVVPVEKKPTISDPQKYNTLKMEETGIGLQLKKASDLQNLFVAEYIPYSMFLEASMLSKNAADSMLVKNIYAEMAARYPANKYTNALKLLIEGKTVRLIDPLQEEEELSLDKAYSDIDTAPDSAIVVLKKLAASTFNSSRIKANFRLGWYYSFEQKDTLKAKTYYDELLKTDRNNDYAAMISRFYNGQNFTFRPEPKDTLAVPSIADTLGNRAILDSLNQHIQSDTLQKVNSDTKDIYPETKPDSTNPYFRPLEITPEIPIIKSDELPDGKPEQP
jgi:TolA-binding protein